MSQAGALRGQSAVIPSNVPTSFVTDNGTAIPANYILNVLGSLGSAGNSPVSTSGVGDVLTVSVQTSQAIAASDSTKVGLSAFDSSAFAVDSNGFVTLIGSSSPFSRFVVDTGTSPVVPAGGTITFNGATVAAGTAPVRTNGTGANTVALEVQIAQALAFTDATKIGLSNFDSDSFSVDANGFVTLASTGPAMTITGNTGGALPTLANNWDILGTGSITNSGAASTLTVQLTGLTNHNVLVGAGTATITKVAPSATSGVPLISQGAAADPVFGTAVVAGGGTGATTLTDHGVLIGQGTAAVVAIAAGTAGQVLQSGGAAADPAYSTATYPSTTTINQLLYSSSNNVVAGLAAGNKSVLTSGATGIPVWTALATDGQLIIGSTAGVPAAATLTAGTGITITNGSNSISIAANGSVVGQTITGDSGGALSPTAGNWNLLGSGSITTSGAGSTLTTQLTGLTNHSVLVGAGTATITKVAPSATSGVPLISQGAASDPAFGTAVVAGGGTGATSFTAYAVVCGGTTSTNPLQSIASVGSSGQVLTSNGAGQLPTFQNSATGGFSPNSTLQLVDDFIGFQTSTLTRSQLAWSGSLFNSTTTNTADHPGVIDSPSVSTNNFFGLPNIGSQANILLGGGDLTINWVMNIVNLSDVTNRYTLRIGMGDEVTGIDQTNGVYFEYSDNINSGNWVLKTAQSSTRTSTNTATAAATGWHNFQIAINAAASSVTYTLDGVSLGSIATNIPTASGQDIFPIIEVIRGAGTVAAGSFLLDLFYLVQNLSTPR